MTQNIYDNTEFFANYSRLPRSVDGLAAAAEWPALRAMLPPVAGRRVLDLGCGFGWFCRWVREQGAARVEGMDVSSRMLERARAETPDAAIVYGQADLESVTLPAATYDLVYSSLALHYIAGLDRLVREVRGALRPGGVFVFSVEHPLYTAPAVPAWQTDPDGRPVWPLNRYLEEGARSTDWLAKGVIKQHRSLAGYVNALLRAGLVLTHLEEWGPTDLQIKEHPEWAIERHRPPFLLVAARL